MNKRTLKILSHNRDGRTGHIEINCVISEHDEGRTTFEGIIETYGIDPLALERRFGGDENAWLAWVGETMLANHARRQAAHDAIKSWVGKHFEIDSNGAREYTPVEGQDGKDTTE